MSVENLAGQTLGQYLLRELIGRGGMAAVYRSYQQSLKRTVAVKILPPGINVSQQALARFTREAETAAALEHPHIVPIYDYGTIHDISFVVMRMLTGGTLSERLKQHVVTGQPLPSLNEIADLLSKLGSALDYAHNAGVVHRDIKPSNIMFDNHGNPFLTDFGIAKLLDESVTQLTQQGGTLGTPTHMPPEQWRGENITPASDQYAMAVVIYQVITGRLPFDAPTPHALMFKHLGEMPPPLHLERSQVPEAVTRVLDRALAKNPADRFPTITAFAQAFSHATAGVVSSPTGFFTFELPKAEPSLAPTPAPTPLGQMPTPPPTAPPMMPAPPIDPMTYRLPTSAPIPTVPATPQTRGFPWVLAVLLFIVFAGLGAAGVVLSGVLDSGSDSGDDETEEVIVTEETPAAPFGAEATEEATADVNEILPSPTTSPTATVTFSPRELAQQTIDARATLDTEFTAIAAEQQTATATFFTATPTATITPSATQTLTPSPTPTATTTPSPTVTLTGSPTADIIRIADETATAASRRRPSPTTAIRQPTPTRSPLVITPTSPGVVNINSNNPVDVIAALERTNYISTTDGQIGARLSSYTIDLSDWDDRIEWYAFNGEYEGFVASVDIEWGPGDFQDNCGLVFRGIFADEVWDMYRVVVDRNQWVAFQRMDDSLWSEESFEYFNVPPLDTSAGATNRLLVVADGGVFSVFINGEYVGGFLDFTYTTGFVAVAATTYLESEETYCRFNNGWVWSIGS